MNKFGDSVFKQLESQRGIGAGAGTDWFFPYPENKTTLEIGFGQGELIRALVERNNNVYGIDVGKESLVGAIEDNFIHKANLLWMDACNNRFPYLEDFFDQAFILECLEHLENPSHIFQEMKRVLKKDAYLMIVFPRIEDNIGVDCGEHAHMYPAFLSKKSFRMFCDQMYFKVVKYKENGSSAWYLLQNIKEDNMIGIHEQIQGNYKYEEIYKHTLNLQFEDNIPYIWKAGIKLFENMTYKNK